MEMALAPPFKTAAENEKAALAARLRQCRDAACVGSVEQVVVKLGMGEATFLGNILVQMYGRFQAMERAKAAFDRVRWKNVFSWTMLIAAYAQNGYSVEAVHLFRCMIREGIRADKVTFLSVMAACGELGDVEIAKEMHSRVLSTGLDQDVFVANAAVHMFGACGSIKEAAAVFWSIPWRDTISWNSMLAAYVQSGRAVEAVELYKQMLGGTGKLDEVSPDEATLVIVLGACSLLGDLELGKHVHLVAESRGLDHLSLHLATALLSMYAKCGCIDRASQVFDRMDHRDVICWTTMIAAYAQNGHPLQAIGLLRKMDQEGQKPNKATFVPIVEAMSQLDDNTSFIIDTTLCRLVSSGLHRDAILGTGLLNLYAKLGRTDEARQIFESSLRWSCDEVAWNSMIMVYAQQGCGDEVLKLYHEMNLEGLWPTGVTFVCILATCSHLGCVSSGLEHFNTMVNDFEFKPVEQHYGCLVDLLGRSGRLEEVERLVECMRDSFPGAWKALLGSCGIHGDCERAARAAHRATDLEPVDWHVILSNTR